MDDGHEQETAQMIARSGEDHPVLGLPPDPPDGVWERAVGRALDPWAVPDPGLVPADGSRGLLAEDGGLPGEEHDGPDRLGGADPREDDLDGFGTYGDQEDDVDADL